MLAFYFWQILIFLNTVKLSRTTELDLELRLGLSRNNEREDTNKEPNPISEKQNERKRKRKTHRNPTPLLQAGKQIEKDKPLPSAQQLKEDEEKAENLLARRLKRQHDKIMGKQLTESQKASHRESMKRYRTKVRANPELYAEMKKRVKENKNERLQFAKQDPTEIAWLKEVKKGYNRKHREKLRQVKLKTKIDLELRLGPTPSEAGESRMDTLDKSQVHIIKEAVSRRHNGGLYVHLLRAKDPQPIKPSSLKRRLKRQAKKDLSKPLEQTEEQKKRHKESQSRYRQKIKSDPILLEEYRKKTNVSQSERRKRSKNDPLRFAKYKANKTEQMRRSRLKRKQLELQQQGQNYE